MNMKWTKFTFKFSDDTKMKEEKNKLDKLGFRSSCKTVDFPTCTPYHLELMLNENQVKELENTNSMLELNENSEIIAIQNIPDNGERTPFENGERGISILLENATKEDIEKIKDFCYQNTLFYLFRYAKDKKLSHIHNLDNVNVVPLFYFWIRSNTKGYEMLNEHMGGRLVLTDYAEFGNIADKDETFMEEFILLMRDCKDLQNKSIKVNDRLCTFIKRIDNVETLKAFLKYSCYLSDFQKKLVQNRIDVLNNERYHFEEEMMETIKSLDCDVAKLRELTGMSRKDFAAYFEIPYRTVEDWENKKSTCSSYLYKLMLYRVKMEFMIGD